MDALRTALHSQLLCSSLNRNVLVPQVGSLLLRRSLPIPCRPLTCVRPHLSWPVRCVRICPPLRRAATTTPASSTASLAARATSLVSTEKKGRVARLLVTVTCLQLAVHARDPCLVLAHTPATVCQRTQPATDSVANTHVCTSSEITAHCPRLQTRTPACSIWLTSMQVSALSVSREACIFCCVVALIAWSDANKSGHS